MEITTEKIKSVLNMSQYDVVKHLNIGFNPQSNNFILQNEIHTFIFDYKYDNLKIRYKEKHTTRIAGRSYSFSKWEWFIDGLIQNNLSLTNYNKFSWMFGFNKDNDLKKIFWPMFQDMFDLIRKNKTYKIKLMPIKNKRGFNRIRQQDWYNKFLKDYVEHYHSKNKSDIMENYYQQQANLYGLKFVKVI